MYEDFWEHVLSNFPIKNYFIALHINLFSVSMVDPGLVVGGGTNPSEGGANLICFIFF